MKTFMNVIAKWFVTAEDLRKAGTKKAEKITMHGCSFGF